MAAGDTRGEALTSIWPHRAVGGNESNQLDLIHGCCACCLVPWPCPSQAALDVAVLTAVGADLDAWRDSLTAMGWQAPAARGSES